MVRTRSYLFWVVSKNGPMVKLKSKSELESPDTRARCCRAARLGPSVRMIGDIYEVGCAAILTAEGGRVYETNFDVGPVADSVNMAICICTVGRDESESVWPD